MSLKGCDIIDFPVLKKNLPSSSKCLDITVMYAIIRNVTNLAKPQNGWENYPSDKDFGTAADIERFRNYRNIIAHKHDLEMKTSDFNEWALDLIWVNTFLRLQFILLYNYMHRKVWGIDFVTGC